MNSVPACCEPASVAFVLCMPLKRFLAGQELVDILPVHVQVDAFGRKIRDETRPDLQELQGVINQKMDALQRLYQRERVRHLVSALYLILLFQPASCSLAVVEKLQGVLNKEMDALQRLYQCERVSSG